MGSLWIWEFVEDIVDFFGEEHEFDAVLVETVELFDEVAERFDDFVGFHFAQEWRGGGGGGGGGDGGVFSVFEVLEEEFVDVDDGVPLVGEVVEDADGGLKIFVLLEYAQELVEFVDVEVEVDISAFFEVDGDVEDVYFFQVVHDGANGVVGVEQEELHGVVADADVFLLDDVPDFVYDVDFFLFGDFDDMEARLKTFDDFLDIAADADEMDIVAVLVDIVAKNMLALFVDPVDVVDDDHFFLAEEG